MEKRSLPKKAAGQAASTALGPKAWVAAAWEALARAGVEGVRVEPLAARLGVTKGSFYWHFRDRAALLDAILADWEVRATQGVIKLVDASSEAPRERLAELLRVTTMAPEAPAAEQAIRAWGAHDPSVRAHLARIDARRERYVEDLLVAAGIARPKAKLRARALYLTLIGEYARVAHGGVQTSAATWSELLDLVLADPSPAAPSPSRPRRRR
ncbi:MAG: TetR/AcrR family transcriptional regulator [Myxococcales bacterium]|nr:TetR/AcrR family transcriptional regulator [Myxococcales bacterium]